VSAKVAAGFILVLIATSPVPSFGRSWKQLRGDGVHDPEVAAPRVLQEPQEALRELPSTASGDCVDWVKALEEQRIKPRGGVSPGSQMNTMDLDVMMKQTGTMAYVKFSHRTHTEWLDCGTCHEEIFTAKIGANPRGMAQIALGKSCGRCHTAVAFPFGDCNRCHTVPRREGN